MSCSADWPGSPSTRRSIRGVHCWLSLPVCSKVLLADVEVIWRGSSSFVHTVSVICCRLQISNKFHPPHSSCQISHFLTNDSGGIEDNCMPFGFLDCQIYVQCELQVKMFYSIVFKSSRVCGEVGLIIRLHLLFGEVRSVTTALKVVEEVQQGLQEMKRELEEEEVGWNGELKVEE